MTSCNALWVYTACWGEENAATHGKQENAKKKKKKQKTAPFWAISGVNEVNKYYKDVGLDILVNTLVHFLER